MSWHALLYMEWNLVPTLYILASLIVLRASLVWEFHI